LRLPSPRHLLFLLLLVWLTACDRPMTVEQRVIAVIRDMEATIEAGERRAFMKHIAEGFTGQHGAMTREQVRAMVVFQLNRHERLQAQLFPIRVVQSDENTASATFTALVTGGPNWIPDSGQVFDFDTQWLLVDGEWKLQSADWTPTVLDDSL
jgi:hypothetical protein